MYKATTRAFLRYNIGRLNSGDYSLLMKLASPDFQLRFPGDNSWSTMFRPVVGGRDFVATHDGIDEGAAFAERFVTHGVQVDVEDILVNGPPWNTRVMLRAKYFIPGADGGPDIYANRAASVLELRWGRLVRWETYEDTERTAEWDRSQMAVPEA